ncbi:hypothetical protein [Natronorubrum halophilum]|uniref:hypothetical protein n=1 Tax=Natronorubrum halophilum TaxID=1702106 RepID=UPI0010C20D67|nr:hypothetical protein [Natronorubrum halophilum]
MLSYQIENFALTLVVAIELQARALEYGTVALFTSLVVLYYIAELPLANLLVVALCLVIVIRIGSEVVGLRITRRAWTQTKSRIIKTSLVSSNQTETYSSLSYIAATLRDRRYPSKVREKLTDQVYM